MVTVYLLGVFTINFQKKHNDTLTDFITIDYKSEKNISCSERQIKHFFSSDQPAGTDNFIIRSYSYFSSNILLSLSAVFESPPNDSYAFFAFRRKYSRPPPTIVS